jgi:hypothetical protein
MIGNEQEFEIVSEQLQELKGQRDSILGGSGDTFRSHVEIAGIEKMIARLQEEIDEYKKSRTATTNALSRTGS